MPWIVFCTIPQKQTNKETNNVAEDVNLLIAARVAAQLLEQGVRRDL